MLPLCIIKLYYLVCYSLGFFVHVQCKCIWLRHVWGLRAHVSGFVSSFVSWFKNSSSSWFSSFVLCLEQITVIWFAFDLTWVRTSENHDIFMEWKCQHEGSSANMFIEGYNSLTCPQKSSCHCHVILSLWLIHNSITTWFHWLAKANNFNKVNKFGEV